MPRVAVVTPPAPVVSLAEAKAHLRVTATREDDLITGMIAAACGAVDGPNGTLGRALGVQTLEARFDWNEPSTLTTLPCGPVISLTSVTYRIASGDLVTADLGGFEIMGDQIYTGDTPAWTGCALTPEAIRIRYQAGYAPAGDQPTLPAPIRAAILLMTADLYRNRDTTAMATQVSKIPMSLAVETLLSPFTVYR